MARSAAQAADVPSQAAPHAPGPAGQEATSAGSAPGPGPGPGMAGTPPRDYVPKRARQAASFVDAITPGLTPPLPADWPLYPDYRPRFAAEAQRYFSQLVPDAGPAATLQGELFRAVEKLWFEGQDNGNVNWGPDFEYFVDLLAQYLLRPGVLAKPDRAMAQKSLILLRHCGRVAYRNKPRWARGADYLAAAERYPGILDEQEWTPRTVELGYIHNDVYQHLRDCCVIFAQAHPIPIEYAAPAGFIH